MNVDARNIIAAIKNQLNLDLPGQHYQNKMSPVSASEKYRIVPKDHRVACVMGIVHPKEDGELYITYIERASSHPDDKHAGQIGFPGGKFEEDDESLIQCALREVEEELGIPKDQLTVLGELTPLYVFASNFLVYPYVGYMKRAPEYVPQVEEVASVIEVPISVLTNPKFKTLKKLQLAEGFEEEVQGYIVDGHFLWGATAMMTSEIEEILNRI